MAKTHFTNDGLMTACGYDVQWGGHTISNKTPKPPAIDNNHPTCKACLRSINRVSDKCWDHAKGVWYYRKPSSK
jgi:hypothetical protein